MTPPTEIIYKSPYPEVPTLPNVNAHHFLLNRPDQARPPPPPSSPSSSSSFSLPPPRPSTWPEDYTVHIDGITGKKRKFREFKERVYDGATALGAPISVGGLGLHGADENGNTSIHGGKREIIGIMSENSLEYITLVHSLLVIATPFALISSYSTAFELKHALSLSKATRLFVDAKHLPLVLPAAREAKIPSKDIYILNGKGGGGKGRRSFGDLIEGVRWRKIQRVEVRDVERDSLAYLVFSSGTSGLPKAVAISHGNLVYSLGQVMITGRATAEVFTPRKPDTEEGIPIALGFLPMHHTYGLHTYCFRSFLAPISIVVIPKWEIESVLKLIPRYRISTLHLIPSVIHQLVTHPKTKNADLSCVLAVNSGAAYLPPDMWNKVGKYVREGTVFTEGYGMSEATIAALTQPFPGSLSGLGKRKPGSAGVLLPGMQARIVVEDEHQPSGVSDAPRPGEIGELWLRSPTIAVGYWGDVKANRETFLEGGWLKTGDRFWVDEEGYFFFADRAKDTLKVSGIQVSPVEIENVLLAHPSKYISDVTVAGVSGHGRTADEKVPRAWVVLSPAGKEVGGEKVREELEGWCKENLSKYKWLRGGIEVVREIPKSPTGKTLRRVLQEKYERRMKRKLKAKL